MPRCSGRRAPVPSRFPHTSDLALWLQMAMLADVGRIKGPPQGYYRVHDASMQRTTNAGHLVDLKGRRDAFDYTLAWSRTLDRPVLTDPEALLATARRSIAAQALDRACRAYDRGRTGEFDVDELVQFALDTTPDAMDLPQWGALNRRRRIGAQYAKYVPPFIGRAALRRASEEIADRRWERTGLR